MYYHRRQKTSLNQQATVIHDRLLTWGRDYGIPCLVGLPVEGPLKQRDAYAACAFMSGSLFEFHMTQLTFVLCRTALQHLTWSPRSWLKDFN